MNKWIATGNLTKDPELKETANGKSYCVFSIAVRRNYKSANGERETDFFNCTLWDKQAEIFAERLSKGDRVLIEGSVKNETYEAQDGSKRTVTKVDVRDFEFLPKNSGEGAADEDGDRIGEVVKKPAKAKGEGKKPTLYDYEGDDEIPF